MDKQKNWFTRHWVLTTIIVLFVLVIVANIFYKPVSTDSLTGNVVKDDTDNQEDTPQESESSIDTETISVPEEKIKGHSSTQSGVTLVLEDYKFVKMGDTFGKIIDLTYSLTNEGSKTLYPTLYIQVYGDTTKNEKELPLTGFLEISYSKLHQTIPVDLTIGNIDEAKEIKLIVYDWSIYNDFVVAVNLKTNLTEGFK